MPQRLKHMALDFVSLVDKGAHQDAHVVIAKRDGFVEAASSDDASGTVAKAGLPEAARKEAQRGLDWRKEYGRGGTEVGIARARDIARGAELSPDTIKRMVSFFARHEVDKQGKGWSPGEDGYPSNGRIAWALWGGDPGRAWARANVEKMSGDEMHEYKPSDGEGSTCADCGGEEDDASHGMMSRTENEVEKKQKYGVEPHAYKPTNGEGSVCADCGGKRGNSCHSGMKKSIPSRIAEAIFGSGTDDPSDVDTLSDVSNVNKVGRKVSRDRVKRLRESRDAIDSILAEVDDEENNVGKSEFTLPEGLPEEVVKYVEALETTVVAQEGVIKSYEDGEDEDEGGEDESVGKADATSIDEIVKSLDPSAAAVVRKMHEDSEALRKQADAAIAIAQQERDERISRDMLAKADSLKGMPGSTEERAALLKSLATTLDASTFAQVEKTFGDMNERIVKGGLFEEAGATTTSTGTAFDQIATLAKAEQATDPDLTFEAAVAKVAVSNPDLYRSYRDEQKG